MGVSMQGGNTREKVVTAKAQTSDQKSCTVISAPRVVLGPFHLSDAQDPSGEP